MLCRLLVLRVRMVALVCIVAAVPTLISIAHTGCSAVGNTLVGCLPAGGGVLTITGTNFYGANPNTVSVNVGCATPLVLTIDTPTFTQITCTLAAGAAGSTTSDLVVTTNGGPTVATGRTIAYGKRYT